MIAEHGEVEGTGFEVAGVDRGLVAVAAEEHFALSAQIETAFELLVLSVAGNTLLLEKRLHTPHEQHFGIAEGVLGGKGQGGQKREPGEQKGERSTTHGAGVNDVVQGIWVYAKQLCVSDGFEMILRKCGFVYSQTDVRE
ncbi:MAG: hypothetical protein SynsKO_27380 [Synoicihabitans sp.]